MKVSDLIRELRKCPPDLPVVTEGCDCNGDTYAVSIDVSGVLPTCVLIERSDSNIDRYEGEEYDNKADTPRPLPEADVRAELIA